MRKILMSMIACAVVLFMIGCTEKQPFSVDKDQTINTDPLNNKFRYIPPTPGMIPKTKYSVYSTKTSGNTSLANRVWDEYETTYWYSNNTSYPQNFAIKLDKKWDIGSFEYWPRQNNQYGRIKNYTIRVSSDGLSWTGSAVGAFPNSSAKQTVTFSWVQESVQYFWLDIASTWSGPQTKAYITELTLIGKPHGPTDGDGNYYKVVVIGNQVWTVENLKTTKYTDGTPIPEVTSNASWAALTTPAYCWYNNDIVNKDVYGAMYNWLTVASTNPKKVAPTGWRVPSDMDWTTLSNYLGGEAVAGGKIKATGRTWAYPNTGATNSSGFTGLPGGIRVMNGVFGYLYEYGRFWSSTLGPVSDPDNIFYPIHRALQYYDDDLYRGLFDDRHYGYYVRLLQDL